MTGEELQAIRDVMREELQPVHEKMGRMDQDLAHIREDLLSVHQKLDHLQFQMDTVYTWVDKLDVDVKELKR